MGENMKGDVILCSYGFGNPTVEDKLHNIIQPEQKKLLIIPFAGVSSFALGRATKSYAVKFGFSDVQTNIWVPESRNNLFEIAAYDYICVPGGDSFKLLFELRENNLIPSIRQAVNGGTNYIGISAGAYIACPQIDYVKFLEDDELGGSHEALGLLSSNVICHFGTQYYAAYEKCRQLPEQVIILTDEQILLIKSGTCHYL